MTNIYFIPIVDHIGNTKSNIIDA